MTNPNTLSDQPPARDYRMNIFDYLFARQDEDPQSTVRLVKRLWEELDPDEQAARYDMTTAFYPKEDNRGRQNLLCGQLILEHIVKEADLALDLDQQFALTRPISPEAAA